MLVGGQPEGSRPGERSAGRGSKVPSANLVPVNEPFEVRVFDDQDQVVLQQSMTSLHNGFVELWLPRDQRFRVRFEARGMAVEGPIETFDGSPTCITDLKL